MSTRTVSVRDDPLDVAVRSRGGQAEGESAVELVALERGGGRPQIRDRAERLQTGQDQRGTGAPHHRFAAEGNFDGTDPSRLGRGSRRSSGALATRRPVELRRELGLDGGIDSGSERVHRAEQELEHSRVGRHAATAQRVEQVLQPVGQVGHAGVPHRRRHALDRVHRPEEAAHRGA